MTSFIYFWKQNFINNLKELKKKPSRLILYIVFIFFLVFTFIASSFSTDVSRMPAAANYYSVLTFGICFGFFMLGLYTGFNKGSSFFSLADVNFLFTSPIKPQPLLFYGLINQAGMVLLGSFFILFQVGTLKNFFGVGGWGFLGFILGWFFMLLICNTVSALVYSLASKSEKTKLLMQLLAGLFLAVPIIDYAYHYFLTKDLLKALIAASLSPINFYTPYGFVMQFMNGFADGSVLPSLIWITAAAAFILISAWLIVIITPDYYEDVLDTAIRKHEMLQMVKENGNAIGYYNKSRKIKVKSTGINNGTGESLYFYRQVTEFRKPLLANLYGIGAVIFAGVAILSHAMPKDAIVPVIFGGSFYILFFFATLSPLSKELTKHFIFLSPGSPYKKLFYLTLYPLLKMFISFMPMTVILLITQNLSTITVLLLPIALTGYFAVFQSASLLARRIMGAKSDKGLAGLITFLIQILMLIPSGIAFGIGMVIDYVLVIDPLFSLLFLSVFSFATYALLLAFSKGILNNTEV